MPPTQSTNFSRATRSLGLLALKYLGCGKLFKEVFGVIDLALSYLLIHIPVSGIYVFDSPCGNSISYETTWALAPESRFHEDFRMTPRKEIIDKRDGFITSTA